MAGNLSTTGGEHAVAYSLLRAVSPTLSIRYTVPQGGFQLFPVDAEHTVILAQL